VGICRVGLQACGTDGKWGPCGGEVVPGAESCNGTDDNCDGSTDEGLKNACGACGALPAEVCNNGLDDNCNGTVDENCGTCDPGCQCMGGSCTCQPPTNQPCYTGPPQTAGVGVCRAGKHDCTLQAGVWRWGPCVGEVLPSAQVCDGADHDCDGAIDDGAGCACTNGAVRACSKDVGACKKGTQTCSGGAWGSCTGVLPATEVCDGVDNDCDGVTDEGVQNACGGCGAPPGEVCGNSLDDDCDGKVDEAAAGCNCGGATMQACYRGPAATRNVGRCKDGVQACISGELVEDWGPCMNDVLPRPEVCGDGVDDDCDGVADDGCVCTNGHTRPCGASSAAPCKKGTQTCVNGQWGNCMGNIDPTAETCDGVDNDCDGLTDDGVLNACGKCPPQPCYTQDYPMPGDCNQPGRTCSDVTPAPGNPSAITLSETTNQLLPNIFIAVTNKNEVARLDTDTGAKIWQRPSFGVNPSRTAVALDGTVWVGNRCLIGGRDSDFTCSSMAHLDLNGNLICRADIPGWVRGVAIDADGNVWAGTWIGQAVWKVHGSNVDMTQTPPRCQVLGSLALGVPIYGLAVDGRGFLWTASNPSKKVRVSNITLVDTVAHSGYYGIAIDKQHRVWFGGWNGNVNMHRIDGDPPYAGRDRGDRAPRRHHLGIDLLPGRVRAARRVQDHAQRRGHRGAEHAVPAGSRGTEQPRHRARSAGQGVVAAGVGTGLREPLDHRRRARRTFCRRPGAGALHLFGHDRHPAPHHHHARGPLVPDVRLGVPRAGVGSHRVDRDGAGGHRGERAGARGRQSGAVRRGHRHRVVRTLHRQPGVFVRLRVLEQPPLPAARREALDHHRRRAADGLRREGVLELLIFAAAEAEAHDLLRERLGDGVLGHAAQVVVAVVVAPAAAQHVGGLAGDRVGGPLPEVAG
jgi:hypothetical protein